VYLALRELKNGKGVREGEMCDEEQMMEDRMGMRCRRNDRY
jgi:hypothetical protein